MIQTESKQILLSIISIAVLIIAFVGVSYATFVTVFEDSQINGISTGTISLKLKNENGALSMENAMPASDVDGMMLDDNNVYDFEVQSMLSAQTTLNYEIYVEKIKTDKPTLSNSDVRFYLEKYEDNAYKSTLITQNPQPFIPLENNSFLGSKKGSMILYSGTLSNMTSHDKEIKDSFRLRMWVAQDTVIDSISRDFNIKLNVVAKAM
ncbi:MAG: hypothetical protein PUE33_05370 [bacterium]|nr:hypothetical protein [Mycoplasmatota bacterium]MDD6757476.1 hypothetical protein [bacterium]MDY2908852.1 hypothetical protein [Candidatus Faecimonas sp.]